MKYIIFDRVFPVIFPDNISHKEIASGVHKEATSAGFIENGKCFGFSDSLGIGSLNSDISHIKIFLKFAVENSYNPVDKTK